jgi:cyclopropane-fatty-acyl-phospholipid synthase
MSKAKEVVTGLLALADVRVDGKRPFDITVNDDRLYKRLLSGGELGLGESYMDGWWDVERLDQLVERLVSAGVKEKVRISPSLVRTVALSVLMNRQTKVRARRNAAHHYNVGNDLYERMLGKRMMYSSAYWQNARTLDEAQEAKLDLICRKLQLKPGMKVLDIGCGWGGFAQFAAEKYGVNVTGITPASNQYEMAKERVRNPLIKFQLKDYREMSGTFDRIVSIGMLEHVGPKNFNEFFHRCTAMLKDDGIMLHHTIGNNRSVQSINPWTDRYIFPGGVIPSLAQVSKAAERRLVIEDVHNFGPDYDKTLMAWHENFVRNYPQIKEKYDDRFFRMWEFYLLTSAGMFRARRLQLYQIVMRKPVTSGSYQAVR